MQENKTGCLFLKTRYRAYRCNGAVVMYFTVWISLSWVQRLRILTGKNRPKFGFGCGFGAETDLKCSFGSVSVTVPTPHFTFGFVRNYTAADRNWLKLD